LLTGDRHFEKRRHLASRHIASQSRRDVCDPSTSHRDDAADRRTATPLPTASQSITRHRRRIGTSTPHRHIDAASTHRRRIDTASTQHRHRIDAASRRIGTSTLVSACACAAVYESLRDATRRDGGARSISISPVADSSSLAIVTHCSHCACAG
jgi:hypothetical protein